MQIVGGRNGYGAKLANIFSTEFTVETCDGQRGRRYKQARSPIRVIVLRRAGNTLRAFVSGLQC